MGWLKELGMKLYKAKMEEKNHQTEKAESNVYSIDTIRVIKKQEDKRRLELRKHFWETKLEYERLKQAGFSYDDIKELCHLTDEGMKLMSLNNLRC